MENERLRSETVQNDVGKVYKGELCAARCRCLFAKHVLSQHMYPVPCPSEWFCQLFTIKTVKYRTQTELEASVRSEYGSVRFGFGKIQYGMVRIRCNTRSYRH